MLARLMRTGLRRGLRSGSRAWLAVGVAAGLVRALRWAITRREQVVLREELRPGTGLEIRHLPAGE